MALQHQVAVARMIHVTSLSSLVDSNLHIKKSGDIRSASSNWIVLEGFRACDAALPGTTRHIVSNLAVCSTSTLESSVYRCLCIVL